MCNISDKRDNKPMMENSYSLDMPYEAKHTVDSKKATQRNELFKLNNRTLNSTEKTPSEAFTDTKITSVVKSSKVGGKTENEEAAHFVFFDMQD